MASGTRILLNLNQCQGPLTADAKLKEAIENAHVNAGVKPLEFHYVTFPDGTLNFHSDLTESHCSGGTYLESRHVALEVHMCNESQDNADLARTLAGELLLVFKPKDFDKKTDWIEMFWKSR